MLLVQKWPFFQLFILVNIGQENVFYDILERKNGFLGYKYEKLKKSGNWHFSKGVNPCFWSKNGHFSNFFFRQYRPGKCVLRYCRTNKQLFKVFLGYIKKILKKSGNWHFSMVLVQKSPFFQLFVLGNKSQENVFYDILERKNGFLGYKNKKLKKSKNWHFSKGVNACSWSKTGHFSKGVNPCSWSKTGHFSNFLF